MFGKGKSNKNNDYEEMITGEFYEEQYYTEEQYYAEEEAPAFEIVDLDDESLPVNDSVITGENNINDMQLTSDWEVSDINDILNSDTILVNSGDKIIIRDKEKRKKGKGHLENKAEKVETNLDEEMDVFSPFAGLGKHKVNTRKKKKYDDRLFVTEENSSDEFRSKSADWKDEDFTFNPDAIDEDEFSFKNVIEAIKHATPLQWVAAVAFLIIFTTGIMTSVVYAKHNIAENRASAMEKLMQYEESGAQQIAEVIADVEEPIVAAEPEQEEIKGLSLVLSSVDKDLKIKLVDSDDSLVKNIPWSVTVTDSKGKETEEEDEDRDGIIHLTDITAGEYSVTLNESEDLRNYELPKEAQVCSVKGNIEYKVIKNIKEEIKSEKEINAAAEDANGNQAADVETGTKIADTVEYLESTQTGDGEEYIEATPDLTKTAKADTSKNIFAFLDKISNLANSIFNRNSVLAYPVFLSETGTVPNTEGGSVAIGVDESEPVGNEELDPSTIPADSSSETVTDTSSSSSTEGSAPTEVVTPTPEIPPASSSTASSSSSSSSSKDTVVVVEESDPTITLSGETTVELGSDITVKASLTPEDSYIYLAEAEDASIVAIAVDGKKIKIKGTKAGSTKINVTSSASATASITITVNAAEVKYADDAQLYDASKNALYVYENDSYRLAKYADYVSGMFNKYFRKSESYKYTGWQTIDGKTYYYKADNTRVTGDQVIGGVTYHFGSDGALSQKSGTLGIDVSKYQPSINWQSVKASGVSYAIIRCGYRGSSTGVLVEDPYFKSHVRGAKAAGLKVGVYFFTTALTEAEAVEEASMAAYLCSGFGIDYPIFMDCENSNRPGYDSLPSSTRTAIIKAFCNTIRSAGYTPGVYANKTWLSSKMNASELSGYKIWLAQYNAAGPTYKGRYDLWQYTSKGSVNGIKGNVDMNQSYLGY